ncbi:MAG: hypothetical protein LBV75_04005 [Paludibacter sp.]|nr:hypothetical protein [Paludibacter sp.]
MDTTEESIPKYVSVKSLDKILKELSENNNFVFTDMYPVIDTLPIIENDIFLLADHLDKLGFEWIDGGWGNHDNGARFRYRVYIKDNLKCEIYKIYQTNKMHADGYYDMIVYEQIKCSKCEK